jgi:hypothetical protein
MIDRKGSEKHAIGTTCVAATAIKQAKTQVLHDGIMIQLLPV